MVLFITVIKQNGGFTNCLVIFIVGMAEIAEIQGNKQTALLRAIKVSIKIIVDIKIMNVFIIIYQVGMGIR
jgi:hypothetical protein